MLQTAPRGPVFDIVRTYQLDYEPTLFTEKEELRAYLQTLGTNPDGWADRFPGARSFDRFWKEHADQEACIGHTPHGTVDRFIRTSTIEISRKKRIGRWAHRSRDLHLWKKQLLIERIQTADGKIMLRRHKNSVSEKLKVWETPIECARRGMHEELKVWVAAKHMKPPYFIEAEPTSGFMKPPNSHLKKDERTGLSALIDKRDTGPYPCVTTHNQLFNFVFDMPRPYWRDIYEEQQEDRKLIARWEDSATLFRDIVP